MSTGHSGFPLHKPALVLASKVPSPSQNVPKGPCFGGVPLLGFSHLVAPVNKNESSKQPLSENHPLHGYVQELQRSGHAPPVVSPLHLVLREILEGKQIQNQAIHDYMERHLALKRYESAFTLLWLTLENQNIAPAEATPDQVVGALIQIFQYSQSQARNAYSAALCLPHLSQIRFNPLLTPYKWLWNVSTSKYSVFWDPLPLLQNISCAPPPLTLSPSIPL